MEEAAEAEREHKKALENLAKHDNSTVAKKEKTVSAPAPVTNVTKVPSVNKSIEHIVANSTKTESHSNLAVALDKDMKTQMVVKVQPRAHSSFLSGIKDPCAGITCASNLKCPAGFSSTEVEGHCCPY